MSSATITHTEFVSGPSTLLALLRVLHLKIMGVARCFWSRFRTVFNTTLRLPSSLATSMTSVLSSKAGYAGVIGAVRGLCRWVWRGLTKVARLLGRTAEKLGTAVITVVGHVSPAKADALYAGLMRIRVMVIRIATRVDTLVRSIGEVLWMLLNTELVRGVSTAVAGIASVLLVIHEATSGGILVWLADVAPTAIRWVAWVTNPWWCLAAVVASAAVTMAYAFLRLLKSTKTGDGDSGDDGPEQPASAADWSRWQETIEDEALDALVRDLHVSVAPDGSVTVSGIPDWVPANLRSRLAKVASEAVIKQWERTVRHRRTPSRDDKRLFTKAARDAVRSASIRPNDSRRRAA